MLQRLLTFGVQRVVGGPARSWVFTSGAMALWRFISSQTGRRETIDLSNTKPGDKILIEHLPITHKQQMKQAKADKKLDKADLKTAKKSAKADKKSSKRVAKASKADAKSAKSAAKAAARADLREAEKAYRKATKVSWRESRRTSV